MRCGRPNSPARELRRIFRGAGSGFWPRGAVRGADDYGSAATESSARPQTQRFRVDGRWTALHLAGHGRAPEQAPACSDRERKAGAPGAARTRRGGARARGDRPRDLGQGCRRGDGAGAPRRRPGRARAQSDHALDLISEIVREASCPVIALLSAKDPAYVHEAAKRGVFAYIVDTTPEELQSAIDITLQRFAEYHNLQGAFGRRATIEQAKGILMARHAINAERGVRDAARPLAAQRPQARRRRRRRSSRATCCSYRTRRPRRRAILCRPQCYNSGCDAVAVGVEKH